MSIYSKGEKAHEHSRHSPPSKNENPFSHCLSHPIDSTNERCTHLPREAVWRPRRDLACRARARDPRGRPRSGRPPSCGPLVNRFGPTHIQTTRKMQDIRYATFCVIILTCLPGTRPFNLFNQAQGLHKNAYAGIH